MKFDLIIYEKGLIHEKGRIGCLWWVILKLIVDAEETLCYFLCSQVEFDHRLEFNSYCYTYESENSLVQ